MEQKTLLQDFEWYLPDDKSFWRKCVKQAKELKEAGITAVWLPPAFKCASGASDVGYGVYDTYDLGEFDQKGTVATKYGTKEEYLAAVKAFQAEGIEVLADIVLNHRMGADACEEVNASLDDGRDRNREVGGERRIGAWTRFTFPGRHGVYSDFTWSWQDFDGVDWDSLHKSGGVFQLEGKNWDGQVDCENGNYDYLMGADLDMGSPRVVEELIRWGKWYLDTVHMDGFRLDAVKHIRFGFYQDWLAQLRAYAGRELFSVGEYWSPQLSCLQEYLRACGGCMSLFDVPLHFHFHEASYGNGKYDMSGLLRGTLVDADAWHAVTFVDNHDTQPGQALESFVNGWFKPLAYAVILLRQEGVPCVFYGDYYGIPKSHTPAVKELPVLLKAREKLAFGTQHDYFDDSSVVGFTREGEETRPGSGLAVLLTDSCSGRKRMYVGKRHAGKTMKDCLGNRAERVLVDAEGYGEFAVEGGSVSVYVFT